MKLLNTLYLGALIGFPMFLATLASENVQTTWLAISVFLIGLYIQGWWAMLFIDAMASDPTKVR